eukprot:TRINITY_DN4218_c0_g1_i2.p1 TRINITY_DN4218_c0_g1~~TRINITY_DN4218_c0_g1_i2.p1  ORF type:complete len:477 (+),score=105.55 TRINITY_DN4218_c0_g1_i2:34-1431(+)
MLGCTNFSCTATSARKCARESGDALLLVLEWVPGGSLAERLGKDRSPISTEDRRKWIQQIATAVHYLHNHPTHQILHRDIKSDNVLLDEQENAKLADFGISALKSKQASVLQTHTAAGTPVYMAVEVLQGKPYSFQADIFSFGILMAEILTRQRPYAEDPSFPEGNLAAEAAYVVAGNRPCLPRDTPRALRKLVELCWDADPAKRPTAAQLVAFTASVPFDSAATRQHTVALERAVQDLELFDVMVSYCWANKSIAHALADELSARGLKVWIDREEMDKHANVFEAMAHGIKSSKVIVALLSPAYEGSKNCKRELSFAAECHKAIIPVRLPTPADYTFGWAGLITAGELYMMIDGTGAVATAATELKQRIQIVRPSEKPAPLALLESMPQTPKPSARIESMDVEGVIGQLRRWGIDDSDLNEAFRANKVTGQKLVVAAQSERLLGLLVHNEFDRELIREQLRERQ